MNSAYVYDMQANAWTQLTSMGIARWSHASAAVGGKLYVFGGFDTANARLSTAEVYLRPCFGQLGASDQLDLCALSLRSLFKR